MGPPVPKLDCRTVRSERGETRYWVTDGAGEVVVFLHGATMDHGLWREQLEVFARTRRVIAPDLPAHGASRPYVPFSLQAALEELIAILDQERVAAAHLVGQSMGGYLAQMLAIERPARARSIVAVDSSPLDSSYFTRLDRWLFSITPALLSLYPFKPLVRSIVQGVAETERGREYAEGALLQLSKREITRIMAAVYQGIAAYRDRAVSWSCPTLVLYGDKDRAGKVIEYSQRWAQQDGLPLQVIEGAGHNSNMDRPAEFNRALLEFLEGVEAGS